MVARNFSLQDLPYSRLLQVPDEEREFLTLEELKPHQLTELGLTTQTSLLDSNNSPSIGQQQVVTGNQQQQQPQQQQTALSSEPQESSTTPGEQYNRVYYDLNAQQPTNGSCANSLYMANSDMTHTGHHVDPSSIAPQMDATATAINNCSPRNVGHQQQQQQQHQQQQQATSPQQQQSSQPQQQQQQLPQHFHESSQSSQSSFQGSQHRSHLQRQHSHASSRKRKRSYNDSDLEDDTGDDAKSVKTTDESKKQNHSEIEKRRRDKMNTYITELSTLVPMCNAMSRKLDKLTVLRMAVQHIKTIRGAVHSYTEGHYKPAFLSDQELKMLILQAAEGFLFVVGCDRGRILYVSESVSQVLNYTQGDLLGQSWFDILHPKDVAKVKEQLSSPDLSPRERLIDAKTMLPVKTDLPQGLSRLCPGARRSFFCRMKSKITAQIKEESDSSSSHRRKKQLHSDKKYCVIQCTGYLKSWAPAKIGLEEQETDGDGDSCNLSCLVAVGRIPPNVFTPNVNPPVNNYQNLRTIQFISRHAMDGKFLFVDQGATLVLGFLPQELLGTSMYEYYHHEDIPAIAESHKAALQSSEKKTTIIYRFRTKDNGFIRLQSEWKSFKNPWTKDVEYLIAKNSVIINDFRDNRGGYRSDNSNQVPNNFEFFNQNNGREMNRIINTHVEASKIGRQIAEQVLDYQRRISDSSSAESSPDPDSSRNPSQNLSSSGDNSISGGEMGGDRRISQPLMTRPNGTLPTYNSVRNNFISNSDNASTGEMPSAMNAASLQDSTTSHIGINDGNDEAAMAVIMSLLEADAGLGGPVDFTGLPWPLP